MRSVATLFLFLFTFALAFAPLGTASGAPGPDPAERGLDVFVHGAPTVIAGDTLSLDVRTYGFPTVTSARPLPNATIVAIWDPETLGPGLASAPGDVTVTTDALGQARLDVPVPKGDGRKISLLVSLRHGEHVRTRKIEITRTPRAYVDLRVPDSHVVPGSQVPAWVNVTDARSGSAVSGAAVDVALLEGDVERAIEHVTTDASGLARSAFHIPARASGRPALAIRARLQAPGAVAATKANLVESKVALTLREETPATPKLVVKWKELQLKPGEIGHAEIRVRDAADEPIASHAVVYWIGPRGTTAPTTDEDWQKAGTAAKTDGLGQVAVQFTAPKVVTSLGSELNLVVRTEIEGQKLEQKRSLPVGQPVATATIDLEGGAVVPGLTQRAYLYVNDGEHGVAGDFTIDADGLKGAKVTTDAHGDAEISWTVPEDVGATRSVGPCAGGVAASVVVRQAKPIAALSRHPEPFELCVKIERERAALLRTGALIARIGDKIKTSVELSKRSARGAGSLVVTTPEGFGSTFWTKDTGEAEIDLANTTPGIHDITLAVPQAAKESQTSTTRVLVLPRTLPKLGAKLGPGKLVPGGVAEIDVQLGDGHGAPIVGSITAVTIDKEGGGSLAGLERLDVRTGLCDQAGAPRERCDAFLENDPSAELLRKRALTSSAIHAQAPLFDPAAHTTSALKKTFSDVLHSLEGAVFQSQTPESLRDVRRKDAKGQWSFNPELMTLVTAAMTEAPTTPGGEPFGLGDLIAVDPQVTFDNVARRVTRLKLFTVLAAMRTFKQNERVDSDEPVLNDPNAILRQLVRDEKLTQEALLDPWGGTIQFVRSAGASIPFLNASRGFALHAPGPDGRVGTGDDVKDPFERVVRTTSPYATAMGEDEIVDARWNMRVGDATVSGWEAMFARLTGTSLGSGSGTGTGEGFGTGHGRLGGSHTTKAPTLRMGSAIVTETARWTEPVRTDAQGRAKLRVPLGEYETTWRIALIARTDAGQSAVTFVDAPTFLPVSARVDIGKKLTLGDELGARIVVRNRTTAAKAVTLDVASEGALVLATGSPRALSVDVPANAVRSVFARFVTKSEGKGKVTVTLRAAGTDGDRSTHEIDVEPAGEPRVIATGAWIAGRSALRVDLPPGYSLRGSARVVIESGPEDALLAALASVEPEPGMSPEALADTVEIAARIEKVAESQGKHWLVSRTRKVSALALAHLKEHLEDTTPRTRAAIDHARLFEREPPAGSPGTPSTPPNKVLTRKHKDPPEGNCPKDSELEGAPLAHFLEAEPPPSATGPLPCFTALMSKTDLSSKPDSKDWKERDRDRDRDRDKDRDKDKALDLARTTLALFDRPHRAPLATTLAGQLAKTTRTDLLGEPAFDGIRADRVIVLAALARSAHTWSKDSTRVGRRLIEAMLALRDVRGGFGSSEATRDAVRALVALEQKPGQRKATRITVVESGGAKHVVDLGANASSVMTLGPQTTRVEVDVAGGSSVLVRLERPVLRNYVAAPDTTITAVAVSTDWPNDARAGTTGIVHVGYKLALGRNVDVWTRLPLPPGVELAAPVKNVALRQGVVHIRATVNGAETISLPVRFTLPGKVLIPEAETRTTSEEQPPALTPARSLVVR